MNVRYSRRALAQIQEVFQRLADDAPNVGSAFLHRVETIASLLARQPAIGRQTDLPAVRVFVLRPYPYLIFYRIDPDDSAITVLRVRHLSRKEGWRSVQ